MTNRTIYIHTHINHSFNLRYGQAVGSELCPMIPTVPQKGMNNRSLSVATGKLLGGGSSINGLVWVRYKKIIIIKKVTYG